MKSRVVWQVSAATTEEAEEAVSRVLAGVCGAPATIHFDALKGTTTVSVFLESRPADLAQKRAVLQARLRELAGWGLRLGSSRLTVRKLPPQDWAESWKRHFRPLEFGGELLIRPSWNRRKPKPGQALIVLDPGLSFGTGQHATTRFCLRELVARRSPGVRQSFLDVGTGSGILAIAAVKLGYAPVRAFDLDPDAVRVARANARRNRVSGKLRVRCQDLGKLPLPAARQYDLICANLTAPVLLAERRRIAGLLRPAGVLVLAGMLRSEFARVKSAYAALGLRVLAVRTGQNWRSGAFAQNRGRMHRMKSHPGNPAHPIETP